MRTEILLRDGYVEVDLQASTEDTTAELGTILSNLAYYGYVPSRAVYEALSDRTAEGLGMFWAGIEPELKKITGADKPMEEFVVYKNFPDEVMSMSEAAYWARQILMYIGFDKAYFTEAVKERPDLDMSKMNLKVLQLASPKDLIRILHETCGIQGEWSQYQFNTVKYLAFEEGIALDLANIPFKANMALIMGKAIELNVELEARTAIDVLRVATAMSSGDTTLNTNTRFRRFKRQERRAFLGMLEKCNNLNEDVFRHAERFKRFLHGLHPNDYRNAYPQVVATQKALYTNTKPETFNSIIETGIANQDNNVLNILAKRPGEFARRLRHVCEVFGKAAADVFIEVMDSLSTQRLLSLRNIIRNYNHREFQIYPPKGNWNKAQINERSKEFPITPGRHLIRKIEELIAWRLAEEMPQGVFDLDERVRDIKLADGADLLPYGRGTAFNIPSDINFIRTASYWKLGAGQGIYNIWYDNGFNFFNKNWEHKGAICWNEPKQGKYAAFSGDPCSSKTKDGQACQVIDLYLDELKAQGIRYAVWNILCFSNKSFNHAEEVYSAMQWGDNAKKGKLFEPARNVMTFPLTGNGLTKFIAMLDVEERQIIYFDANLKGQVNSAESNCEILQESMPAFMEYLNDRPSVYDLFNLAPIGGSEGVSVLYSDKDPEDNSEPVTGSAYVFRQENEESEFESFDFTDLLNSQRSIDKVVG